MPAPTPRVELERSVRLLPLVFFGLGTMVGGGFYALVGRVAGLAGPAAPIALAGSGLLALLSAASFAELSSRFPVSAGEVRYVEEGFHRRWLAVTVGWMVITTGVVSAATLSVATIGFVRAMVQVPELPGLVVVVLLLGGVAAWGIGESVRLVFVITFVEIGALVYAALVAGDGLVTTLPARWPELVPAADVDVWVGIFGGSFLAFYAFIGFEDLVNIAEEVKEPHRALPIALFAGVIGTTALYMWVATVAVLAVPPAELAASSSPVALLVRDQGAFATTGVGVVSVLTGVNGALVQIVMASRVAYGMARRGQAPPIFGVVHPWTRTPVISTALMTVIIGLLALFFPLTTLARSTSTVILVVFTLVNLSLWRIKQTAPDLTGRGPRFPGWLPVVGAITCAGVLAFQGWTLLTPMG